MAENKKNRLLGPRMGILPPQNQELEQVVLGCIMLEKIAALQVQDILQDDTFYNNDHAQIWACIQELYKENKPISSISVLAKLDKKGWISPSLNKDYLVSLTNNITNTDDVESWAREIEERAISRRYIAEAHKMITRLYANEEDISEVITESEQNFMIAKRSLVGTSNVTSRFYSAQLIAHIEKGLKSGGITGIPTYIEPIDQMLGGFQKKDTYMIGARTRMGKSAVAANFLYNSCREGDAGVFFSMEMPGMQIMSRMASMHLRYLGHSIPYSRIHKSRLSADEFDLVKEALKDIDNMENLIIDETPAQSPLMLKSKMLRYINEYNIQISYVDYIQLMQTGKGYGTNTAELIGQNAKDMKSIAKSLDIPIVMLSQVGREAENQSEPGRPMLKHLKGSGGLEEAADNVILLYRPDVVSDDPVDAEGNSERGIMYVDIAKQKNGETGLIKIPFDVATNYFEMDDFVENNWKHSTKTPEAFKGASSFHVRHMKSGDPGYTKDVDEDPPF